MKVRIQSLGPFREKLGWGERELDLPEGASVRDALTAVSANGATLYDLLTANDEVRGDKWLRINGGKLVRNDLDHALSEGDTLLVMDVIVLAGG